MPEHVSIEGTEGCLFAEGLTIGRVVSSEGALAMAVRIDGRIGGPGGEPSTTTVVLGLKAAFDLGGEVRKTAREWALASGAATPRGDAA
jgi:hypothetical protein